MQCVAQVSCLSTASDCLWPLAIMKHKVGNARHSQLSLGVPVPILDMILTLRPQQVLPRGCFVEPCPNSVHYERLHIAEILCLDEIAHEHPLDQTVDIHCGTVRGLLLRQLEQPASVSS